MWPGSASVPRHRDGRRISATEHALGREHEISPRSQATLLVLLTAAAAAVDAISYLGLGRVFTANMTGNTVLLALAAVQGELKSTARLAVALFAFAAGAGVGAFVARWGREPRTWPLSLTMVVVIEIVLLGGSAAAWAAAGSTPGPAPLFGLIALTALTMGMQSAAVRTVSGAGVTTTFITGTWTDLISGLTGPAGLRRNRSRRAAAIGAYIAGAALGGALLIHEPPWISPLLPAALLVVVAASASLLVHNRPGCRPPVG
jgi:uncharacterized membrane protein YoaK (UPF0700 family)